MRQALVETLVEAAEADERLFLLTADLGWSVVEPFARRFPDRFLNVGVAEANMVGVATGLALVGYRPFVYSIATFATTRCLEQLRNGPVHHRLPVRVVGIGGGFAYGHAGPSHYALEDLALMRGMPGMTTLCPADPAQTRAATRAAVAADGPVYLRVGKGGNAPVPGLDGRFAFGVPEVVRDGRDVLFVACGSLVHAALAAAERLEAEGRRAAVAVMAHLPYRPSPALEALLSRYTAAVSVEEGYVAGGLGALVAAAVAAAGRPVRLAVCGVAEQPGGATGSEAWLRRAARLDPESLAAAARDLLAG